MMRIAVVSDIHGSIRALEAVVADLDRRRPDLVVHGGDLGVNGPRPAEVIDLIRELGWPGVLGNTDEMLWAPERLAEQEARAPKLRGLLHVLFEHTAPATADMLGEERVAWLKKLPTEWRHEEMVLLHASPGDLWRAPMPDADDETIAEVYGGLRARTIVYGHIHRPFVRNSGLTSGSIGLPYDGDWRPSYLLIDEGGVSVERVEYDLEGEVADLLASGYPYASWLAEMRTAGTFRPPPTR